MAVISDLAQPVSEWRVQGVPLTAMLSVPASSASGGFQPRPVIFPRRVDLEGAAFRAWRDERAECSKFEMYQNPGPIQLSGPSAGRISKTITAKPSYLRGLDDLRKSLAKVSERCRPGCDPRTVRVAKRSLSTLNQILDELSGPADYIEQRETDNMAHFRSARARRS